jgi:uncharacterized protein YqhQ
LAGELILFFNELTVNFNIPPGGCWLERKTQKAPLLGGQAVIEGVMMRFGGSVATAVRKADGTIVVRKENRVSFTERHPWLRAPVLRGAVGLVEMLGTGLQALNFSAEVILEASRPKKSPGLGPTMVLSLVLGVGLFFVIPLYAATAAFNVEQDPFLFNLLAGAIRAGIFLVYLLAISLLKDIHRLFQYHGAEHKAVFALERGNDLSVEACRGQRRFHPRCGTSFLLVVMVVAIVLFALLDALLITWLGRLTLAARLATHLPLLPLVLGVAYEGIRFSARHADSVMGRAIAAPGLWLQRLTTKEPDDRQLEVALAALRAALGGPVEEMVSIQAISVE